MDVRAWQHLTSQRFDGDPPAQRTIESMTTSVHSNAAMVKLTTPSIPCRARVARRLIQMYNFPRGKDRLYLILRSVLSLPRRMVIDLDSSLLLSCDLDEFLQRWLYCNGLDADPDFVAMRNILHPRDHFVDVGANIGVCSLIASVAVGEKGIVYAVEALPSTLTLLEENLELNKITNVRILPIALTDHDGEVVFYGSTNGNLGASSLSNEDLDGVPVSVPARMLDSLIAEGTISGCDVLKIDIEGAELLALRGMQKLFEEHPPRAVMIEVSEPLLKHFSRTPKDLIDFFTRHGYVWHRATAKGLERLSDLNVRGHQNLWALRS